MRRPIGVTLLAIFVAWQSFGLLPLALVLAGPHTDLPLQPLPSLLGLTAASLGFVLVHRLWRMRASAPTLLLVWAALVLAFVAFWPAIASPGRERRGAVVAVMLAVLIVSTGAVAFARYLRAVIPTAE